MLQTLFLICIVALLFLSIVNNRKIQSLDNDSYFLMKKLKIKSHPETDNIIRNDLDNFIVAIFRYNNHIEVCASLSLEWKQLSLKQRMDVAREYGSRLGIDESKLELVSVQVPFNQGDGKSCLEKH